jgi:hypothetical protein
VPQVAAKFLGYTAPYLIYSLGFISVINDLLAPKNTEPSSLDSAGNATMFNSTVGGGAELPVAAWNDYIAANAFNGFVMAIPFMARNILIGRALEYGFNNALGWAGHLRARFGPAPDQGANPDQGPTPNADADAVDSASQSMERPALRSRLSPTDLWMEKKDQLSRWITEGEDFKTIALLLEHCSELEEEGVAGVLENRFDLSEEDVDDLHAAIDDALEAAWPHLDDIFGPEVDQMRQALGLLKIEHIVL